MLWVFIIVGVIIVLKAAVLFCIAPGRMSKDVKSAARVFYGLNCAHRGLHTKDHHIPENSIPAFEAAKNGNYGVELDVQLSKDNQVVVFHDCDLKRVCGIDIPVSNLDWQELSSLLLYDTTERIPLLKEALETLGDTPVIVELKSAGEDNELLCEETLQILRKYGHRWCIESYDPAIVAWFRKNAPDVPRGQLSCRPHELEGISGFRAFMLGNLLTNFISRPHFIAYKYTRRPLLVKLCRLMKPMKIIWTLIPGHDISKSEKQNDTIIFELYEPASRFQKKVTYLR